MAADTDLFLKLVSLFKKFNSRIDTVLGEKETLRRNLSSFRFDSKNKQNKVRRNCMEIFSIQSKQTNKHYILLFFSYFCIVILINYSHRIKKENEKFEKFEKSVPPTTEQHHQQQEEEQEEEQEETRPHFVFILILVLNW